MLFIYGIIISYCTSYSSKTSTHALGKHLKEDHDIDWQDKEKTVKTNRTLTEMFFTRQTSSNAPKSNQKTKKIALSRQIALMCALDFEAFNITNRAGFRQFCEFQKNSVSDLPSDRNIAENGLDDVYKMILSKIKIILQNAPNQIAMTLDCWTDNYRKRPYMTFRIHFCQDFKISVISLKTELFHHPHTGVRICQSIESTIQEFNLSGKKILAISDNGSNVVSGLRLANIERMSCAAHNLHLFISADIMKQKIFEPLAVLIKKLKSIYKALTYKYDELKRYHDTNVQLNFAQMLIEAMDVDEDIDDDCQSVDFDPPFDLPSTEFESYTNIKNSMPTRWNSLLNMVQSFNKNAVTINIALSYADKNDLVVGEMDKNILKEFEIFLNIFKVCSVVLQGQSYPTLSLNILFLEKMMKK